MAEAGKKPFTPRAGQADAEARAASGGKESSVTNNDNRITVNNTRAKEDRTGRDIQNALMANRAAAKSTI